MICRLFFALTVKDAVNKIRYNIIKFKQFVGLNFIICGLQMLIIFMRFFLALIL